MLYLPVAFALLAVAREQECHANLASCYYSWDEGSFGYAKAAFDATTGSPLATLSDAHQASLCNRTNWMNADFCLTNCPLSFEVTEPAELRMSFCISDNTFVPYVDAAHIHLTHPLNMKEMEIVSPGTGWDETRKGCTDADYVGLNLTDKIAVVRRGTCYFDQKFRMAGQNGAAIAMMVNHQGTNSLSSQLSDMTGETHGLNIPSYSAPRQHGSLIFRALDSNIKVKGRVRVSCTPFPEDADVETYPENSCPNPSGLGNLCAREPDTKDRLCEHCPIKMHFPNGVVSCLRGNDLLPRKTANLMNHQPGFTFPYHAAENEILVLSGCSVAFQFAAGKIVFGLEGGSNECTPFEMANMAQMFGAKALIMLSRTSIDAVPIYGPSQPINIPVHSIQGADLSPLYTLLVGYLNYGFNTTDISFTLGEYPPTPPPYVAPDTPTPTAANVTIKAVLDERPAWEWTETVIVCLVLILLQFFVLAGIFHHQHKNAIELPSEGAAEGFAIPLSVASMGLSLSLLLVISVVAFTLAYLAGEDSTNTALKDGRAATNATYANAVSNVDELASQVRNLILTRTLEGVDNQMLLMEGTAEAVHSHFARFDGSWANFDAALPNFVSYAKDQWYTSYLKFNIFTDKGFFANDGMKTDDRPDSERRDGVTGTVAETDNGFLYGINQYTYEASTQKYWATSTIQEFNASTMLGGYTGDPVGFVKNLPSQAKKWYVSKRTLPQVEDTFVQPISVFTPIRSTYGFNGAIEVRTHLEFFRRLISLAVSDPRTVNMTMVMYDRDDLTTIISNVWQDHKSVAVQQKTGTPEILGMYPLAELPPIHMRSMSNYMERTGKWAPIDGDGDLTSGSGLFEQQAEYTPQDFLTEIKVVASNGKAVDATNHSWHVEIRDGKCGNCVVFDDQLGREVMVFDGEARLYIYTNLTTDVPAVAATRDSPLDHPWNSTLVDYQHAKRFSDGTECVAMQDLVTPTAEFECVLRYPFSADAVFVSADFSLSMRIRPDVLYDDPAILGIAKGPRLISDTLSGESGLRVFANGQMFMNVLTKGCATKAYAGGFPVGAWTTVTVAIINMRCSVYVNGTLYASDEFAQDTMTRILSTDPYRIGDGFRGRIENIQFFDMELTDYERMGLHEHGSLVRKVDPREWYVESRPTFSRPNRLSVPWSVAVAIPRADIMREVDANNEATLTYLEIQEENTNKQLRQRSNETIMVIVVIALTSVIVFLVFNDVLTRPFANCAVVMTEAAVLKIDAIPSSESYIKEMRAMNRAMVLMLKNLREYKSYMPQSLQLDDTSEDDSVSEHRSDDASSRLPSSRSRAYSHHSSGSRSSRSGTGGSSFHSKSESVKFQAGLAGQKRQGMACSLSKRKFSMLVVNVRDWHDRIQKMSDKDVLALHSGVLHSVLGAFMFSKGISEVFSGDRFVCTYNAAKPVATHRMSACSAACIIEQKLKDDHQLLISSAAVSGEGRVGNMGTEIMKRFTMMSSVVTWGFALERYTRSRDLSIVVDSYVYEDVMPHFKIKVVDEIEFTKRSRSRPIKVAEMPGKREGNECDEWMYELEASERTDLYRAWNDWACSIFESDFETSTKFFENAKRIDSTSTVYKSLYHSFSTRSFSPTQLLFH
eukprot:TRINITY_DN4017_c0_g2_i1.p1 TRINITY_DN4017_c0_g2~~TRINITY_DN4017_c0_g2_i1.p1  ORF type:complete len:1617 (+),score=457.87 TRINITY_DN4017_c0_g2_i1:47-4897(+)